eukprot:g77517.t1
MTDAEIDEFVALCSAGETNATRAGPAWRDQGASALLEERNLPRTGDNILCALSKPLPTPLSQLRESTEAFSSSSRGSGGGSSTRGNGTEHTPGRKLISGKMPAGCRVFYAWEHEVRRKPRASATSLLHELPPDDGYENDCEVHKASNNQMGSGEHKKRKRPPPASLSADSLAITESIQWHALTLQGVQDRIQTIIARESLSNTDSAELEILKVLHRYPGSLEKLKQSRQELSSELAEHGCDEIDVEWRLWKWTRRVQDLLAQAKKAAASLDNLSIVLGPKTDAARLDEKTAKPIPIKAASALAMHRAVNRLATKVFGASSLEQFLGDSETAYPLAVLYKKEKLLRKLAQRARDAQPGVSGDKEEVGSISKKLDTSCKQLAKFSLSNVGYTMVETGQKKRRQINRKRSSYNTFTVQKKPHVHDWATFHDKMWQESGERVEKAAARRQKRKRRNGTDIVLPPYLSEAEREVLRARQDEQGNGRDGRQEERGEGEGEPGAEMPDEKGKAERARAPVLLPDEVVIWYGISWCDLTEQSVRTRVEFLEGKERERLFDHEIAELAILRVLQRYPGSLEKCKKLRQDVSSELAEHGGDEIDVEWRVWKWVRRMKELLAQAKKAVASLDNLSIVLGPKTDAVRLDEKTEKPIPIKAASALAMHRAVNRLATKVFGASSLEQLLADSDTSYPLSVLYEKQKLLRKLAQQARDAQPGVSDDKEEEGSSSKKLGTRCKQLAKFLLSNIGYTMVETGQKKRKRIGKGKRTSYNTFRIAKTHVHDVRHDWASLHDKMWQESGKRVDRAAASRQKKKKRSGTDKERKRKKARRG